MNASLTLTVQQALPTRGARAAHAFCLDGDLYLAVPQLARDVPGEPAAMTGGDSDVASLLFRWQPAREGGFVLHQALPISGGEDAEFFRIGARAFLATASLRRGADPSSYRYDVESILFEWNGRRFEPFQRFATVAAKQWRFFEIDGRAFLALAQGATPPGQPVPDASRSTIFEWNGVSFAPLQSVESAWGYNWTRIDVDGVRLLAYCDHAAPSRVLRWNGGAFEPFQPLDGASGRAVCHFQSGGEDWIAFANLLGESSLYRWERAGNGSAPGRFVRHQVLSGPGGREFCWIDDANAAGGGVLLQVNFIRGSREQPQPALDSVVHAWQGDRLVPVQNLPTLGAVEATLFEADGARHLVVAQCLSADVRFEVPSPVYRIERDGRSR